MAMSDFFLTLKKDSYLEESNIVGTVTIHQLVDILSSSRRLKFPMVFGIVCKLVEKSNNEIKKVMEEGIRELELIYFPAVRLYDNHINAVLVWSPGVKFWKIVGLYDGEYNIQNMAIACRQVLLSNLKSKI